LDIPSYDAFEKCMKASDGKAWREEITWEMKMYMEA